MIHAALTSCLLLFAAMPAVAAPATQIVDVIKVEFGIFEDDGSDQLGFGETGEIPLAAGQAYGWLIQVKTASKSLAVREELFLPSEEATPAESKDTDLTPPANHDVLLGFNERRVPVADGMIFGVRKVLGGDAPGRYRLKVYVERRLAATFDYRMAPPESLAAPEPQVPKAKSEPPPKGTARATRRPSPPPPAR